jgi:hypothetical protein
MDTKVMLRKIDKSDIQSSFLKTVRSRIPFNTSFPDELAEHLSISRDSAYRRIRNETILSLDEARILCDRYSVSIDSLIAHESGNVSFELRAQNGSGLSFQSWLESILSNLETLGAIPGGDMIWHSKDLPIFHYFQFPRLAAFKLFFWMKLSTVEDFGREKYEEKLVGSKLISLGEKIWEKYSRIPSTEIICRELVNTTLRQIEYGFEVGLFDKARSLELCRDCAEMIRQLQNQTQDGFKRMDQAKPDGRFNVYVNELLIGDNTILFRMGEKRTTFVTHNNFNILSTGLESFGRMTEQFMNSMERKSVLISGVAQKERIKFFNRIYRQIEELEVSIHRGVA